MNLALDVLEMHPFSEIESGLLLSLFCDEPTAAIFAAERGFKAPSWWATHAKEEEAIGSDADAVTAFVIAHLHSKAAMLGMSVLKRFVNDPWTVSSSTYKILHALKFVNTSSLDEPLRGNFFAYMLWFAAHEAAGKGLMACSANMLITLLPLVVKSSFPISESMITYQALFFRILAGQDEALPMLDDVLSKDGHTQGALADGLKALKLIAIDRVAWDQWRRLVQPQTATLVDEVSDKLAVRIIR